jgi:hypothetical protein
MSNSTPSVAAPPVRSLAKSERRQWIRYNTSLLVSIRRFGARDDLAWRGQLRDLSATGAGLVSESAVDVGAVLEVRPLNCTWNIAVKLTVRVRKTVTLPTGGWLLGCTFVRQLTDEELQSLL